jgi:hypothetical protein
MMVDAMQSIWAFREAMVETERLIKSQETVIQKRKED